jgi:1-acyl-sn-glycerol-3-phosphate acyltransferase
MSRSHLARLALWPLRIGYGLYAWTVFSVLAAVAVLGVLAIPSLRGRRHLVRGIARLLLRAVGLRLSIQGAERLPAGQCVIVANHASYLDGVVFKAALPPRFSFVIKREMNAVPLAGLVLRRIGSEFVDRSNRQRAASDARRMLRAASGGHSLVFFPEGTFTQTPGLAKFHTGAFVTASRAHCPIVPVVVRGTRQAMPNGTLMPRPGRIEVEILGPLETMGDDSQHGVERVREQARGAILSRLGEPDLSPQRPVRVPRSA